ncbi:Tip elongation aberrant protein 1 [Phialemonium atrogriseum]|uniref:Tip elongation aberrant protein 1 n=1 Tax=Phialemonium atrogriseum TaxID=1093897 RepID=A0AAJ0BUM6_9PEZI|nr:Tip elongation aberrant protein 1 [Phialemonium atrogriseum]KAK1764810.1 Tip elongation aberrant protein 1 [Phialemonium atrogriseum]
MADARGKDRPSHSSSRTKVVRSQKISQSTSPIEPRHEPFEGSADETHNRAPPIPRSHTPGHLASKSQDRRHRPSELSLRQRSQSAAGGTLSLSASQATFSLPSPAASTPKPLSATTSNGGEDVAALTSASATQHHRDRDRHDSSAGSGRDSSVTSAQRPTNLRSTSAIAARPGISGSSPVVHRGSGGGVGSGGGGGGGWSTRLTTARGVHTAFPPLADARTAPDVPAAPSSGMYWSRAPVSGSPHTALRAHTTTLVGSNVYVFGGCDSRTCFNELYVLDADSFHWSTPHVVGDLPLPLRAMTCTAVGKKLVVFGGGDGPAYYNDVYVLDTVNFRWSRPRILGDKVPSKRRAHTACLYKNGIYVFGGGDGVRALNDIWRLDVSDTNKMSWKLVSAPTSPPSPSASSSKSPGAKDGGSPKARGYHTANMVGSKLIIFGGSDGGECFNDVWVYDVETHAWKAVHIPVTHRRLSHTATIVGSYLFVVGGHDGNEYSNDVLLLNLVTMTWDRRKVYGLPPSGRGYHGTALHDSRLLVIGGFDGSEVFGDVWILELAVHAYYSQISHFTIEV